MSVKKRNYMAKNKKDFYSAEKIKRRAKEYNCDEMYYTSKSVCPRAEICPETCVKEFWTTMFTVIVYIPFFNPVAWIIWVFILNWLPTK